MPFSIGNSDNWLDVCAHMMGKPLSIMTAERPRDAAQARRRPRSTARSMAEDLEVQRERDGQRLGNEARIVDPGLIYSGVHVTMVQWTRERR